MYKVCLFTRWWKREPGLAEAIISRTAPLAFERVPPLSVMHVVGSLQGGGAERCVRELVPHLRARGAHVEVATVYSPNLAPADLSVLGYEVHHHPKRPGFDTAHCWWLSRIIANRRPAIVHTHMQAGKYVGRLAAILAGVKIIVHTEHSPNPVTKSERAVSEIFSRRTAAVITFAEENAALIRQREAVRCIEIIRNGITLLASPTPLQCREARHSLGIADDAVVVAIVASFQQRKNHRLALTALAQLKNDPARRIELALFGDGTLRDELVSLAASLGISDQVRFYGFCPSVRDLLPGVDALLSVSLLEMAPISILEAMASCLPIVATPHLGTGDMVVHEQTGLIVDWDAASVAAALRRLRDDRQFRSKCGAAGRRRVERNHDIGTIAEQHVALYDRLLLHA